MANMFDETERLTGPAPNAAPAAPGNMFDETENPGLQKVQPKPGESVMGKVEGFLRMASNALTLGGRDRLAGMMPGTSYKEQEARSNQFKKDNPWTTVAAETVGGIVPAAGLSAAAAKLIPAVGRATIPMIASREALAGGAMPVIEDLVRGRPVDPVKAATGAVVSGGAAAGTAALASAVSPSFKTRRAGADLTPADKATMTELSATADRAGIPVDLPELARAAAPGRSARLESLKNYNTRMKNGSIENVNFDAARLEKITSAVGGVKTAVGESPADLGLKAEKAATAALDRHNALVKNSAAPFFSKAEPVVLPVRRNDPTTIQVRKDVYADPVVGPTITNDNPNSVKVLHETQMGMEKPINEASNWPRKQGLLIDAKRNLIKDLEDASPDYATARGITREGGDAAKALEAGPLGTIGKTTKPQTQANALFGVDSQAEADAAINAARRMNVADPTVPQGLLASRVDEAARDPVKFGAKVAPTSESERVMAEVLGPEKWSAIQDVITASKIRSPAGAATSENSDGPVSGIWNTLQNLTSGKVMRNLQDTGNIEKLGTIGPIHSLLNAGSTSLGNELSDPLGASIEEILAPLLEEQKPRRRKKEEDVRRAASRS
jgi:hypothetical protein